MTPHITVRNATLQQMSWATIRWAVVATGTGSLTVMLFVITYTLQPSLWHLAPPVRPLMWSWTPGSGQWISCSQFGAIAILPPWMHQNTVHEAVSSHGHAFEVGIQRKLTVHLPACKVARVIIIPLVAESQTTVTTRSIQKQFSKVFQGLRTLTGEYHIQLLPDTKPHALFTPWHIPLHLPPKLPKT